MRKQIIISLLVIVLMVSALSVVYAKHQSRKLFVELNSLHKLRDDMDVEWGKLQLEQSTWATHGRIERVAQKRLHMLNPENEKVIIVGSQ